VQKSDDFLDFRASCTTIDCCLFIHVVYIAYMSSVFCKRQSIRCISSWVFNVASDLRYKSL